ncbi:hypothetical protein VNO77_24294 [Canavalia gladiata]|uniref:Uncharacterized protein n=1 Tax=Canavalia gladiata TaxID=3824 RepID=A0AAN9QG38_CANGL
MKIGCPFSLHISDALSFVSISLRLDASLRSVHLDLSSTSIEFYTHRQTLPITRRDGDRRNLRNEAPFCKSFFPESQISQLPNFLVKTNDNPGGRREKCG